MKEVSLLVIAALLFCCSCKKPEAFEYRDMRNFSIDSLGFNSSAVSMDLVYFNPNNFGVRLKNIDCDIYVDHAYLGKYLLDTNMFIPRRSEFCLPSRMSIDMRNIFKNSLNSIFSNGILLEAKGTARVGKAGIYATIPFSYSGRHTFTLFK